MLRERGGGYVKVGVLQLALREMRDHFGDRRTWMVMAAIVIVLGLSGPFGTFEAFAPAPRLAYWTAVVILTYGVGFFAGALLDANGLLARHWLRLPVYGLLTGIPVWSAVVLVQLLTFGVHAGDAFDLLTLFIYCALISTTVLAVGALVPKAAPAAAAEVAPQTSRRPALLDRLQPAARGQLLYLSMQDHYVLVVTDRGKELVLLRLSDAIKETEGVQGVQIHRSHWVALGAVQRAVRDQGKVLLEISDGARLPVSRGFLETVRAAGLTG